MKFCIVKIYNDFYAIRSTQVVDVVDGFSDRLIEVFSTEREAHLIYKTQQVQMINPAALFGSAVDSSVEMKAILIVRNYTRGNDSLHGLPINELVGFSFFEDRLLMPFNFFQCKNYCLNSFEHNNMIINILDMNKLYNLEPSYQIQIPKMSGVKVHLL